MKKLIKKYVIENKYVNEPIQVRIEKEDNWYLVTLKGLKTNYQADCYFKDFIELLNYTLNITFTNMAMEEEIKVLRERLNG